MSIYNNITFKDTLNFMPCALKQLPKCMGLEEAGLEKGFFPYEFLTLDTVNYIGPIPALNMFETDRMNDTEKREFNAWYKTLASREYNLKDECTKYCVQDVDILRRIFEKFRKMFLDMFKVDCLTESSTIASLCLRVFKMWYMQPNTIAHIGRRDGKRYSLEGVKFLEFMERYTGQSIAHARNGGERKFKLRNRTVWPDGYAEVPSSVFKDPNFDNLVRDKEIIIDESLKEKKQQEWKDRDDAKKAAEEEPEPRKRIVYLFHGCSWHGHYRCEDGRKNREGVSSVDLHNATLLQEKAYTDAGFHVVRIWKCQ